MTRSTRIVALAASVMALGALGFRTVRHRRPLLVAALALAIGGAVAAPTPASAHESREVAGKFSFVVGFLDEPAFAGLKNGLDLRVSRIDPAGGEPAPVEFLAGALEVEVVYGGERMPLDLRAAYGEPGTYSAIFFPTQPGEYSFRITGTIEGTPIDETFTSGPETFSSVRPVEPLLFPRNDGTPTSTDEPVGIATEPVAAPATPAAMTAGAGNTSSGGAGDADLTLAIVAGAALAGGAFAAGRLTARRRPGAATDHVKSG